MPEEKNKDGKWVPKGTKPALQLSHQQVRFTSTLNNVGSHGWSSTVLMDTLPAMACVCWKERFSRSEYHLP